MNRKLAVLFTCLTSGACGGIEQETLEVEMESEIRNGTETAAYPTVGALYNLASGTICTATLLNPQVLLTAAHCVTNAQPSDLAFTRDAVPNQNSQLNYATDVVVHNTYNDTISAPVIEGGYATINAPYVGADLAIVKLSNRYAGLTYYALDTELAGFRGEIIGYGVDETNTNAGVKRSGFSTAVSLVDQPMDATPTYRARGLLLSLPSAGQVTCPGDSGGPLLRPGAGTTRFLSGVASFGFLVNDTGICTSTYSSYHVTVGSYRDWISANAVEFYPPGACVGLDNAAFATTGGGCLDRTYNRIWSDRAVANRNRPQAVAYCNALVEGGKNDWRLPTQQDLILLHRSGGAAALGTGAVRYWSSSVTAAGGTITVRVSDGAAAVQAPTTVTGVFCVRTPT